MDVSWLTKQPAVVGLSILVAANSASTFMAAREWLPKKDAEVSEIERKEQRKRHMIGATVALGVGAATSITASSPWPFAVSAFIVLAAIIAYEGTWPARN